VAVPLPLAMASNDPTDTGGLFIGRRPGTAAVRYRHATTGVGRRRFDRLLAAVILGVELLLCLSLFGPQPAGWMWVGSQVQYLTGYVTAGIAMIMAGCLASLFVTMVIAKRVDHAWKLVRRAAGYDQQRGALERMFAASVAVAAVGFSIWFLVIHGPGSQLFPGRPA
jgi:hypothetical protein